MYFHNLLRRNKSQTVYAFLMSQISNPTKGDIILQIYRDLDDLGIEKNISFIQKLSLSKFKDLVNKRSLIYAFQQFYENKNRHSKMRYLEYPELKMQQYLLESTLTVATKKCIFKWRTHTENFGENFRGGRREVVCPLCFSHKDDQISSLTICQPLIQEIKSIDDYQTIFSEIEKHPKLIDTITRVSKLREQKLKSVS